MSGSYNSSAENDPGVPVAMAHVVAGVAAATAELAASQAEARAFIEENGAAVVGGHPPVNPPSGAFMTHVEGLAPMYPPGLDTLAVQAALVGPNTPLLHPTVPSGMTESDAGND